MKMMEKKASHLQNIRAQMDHSKELVKSVLQPSVPDQNLLKAEELIRTQLKRLEQCKVALRSDETDSRLELSFQSKFRGDGLHDILNNVIMSVLSDVKLKVQLREEGAGTARVSQTQPSEKEGERRPVRQLESLQKHIR